MAVETSSRFLATNNSSLYTIHTTEAAARAAAVDSITPDFTEAWYYPVTFVKITEDE